MKKLMIASAVIASALVAGTAMAAANDNMAWVQVNNKLSAQSIESLFLQNFTLMVTSNSGKSSSTINGTAGTTIGDANTTTPVTIDVLYNNSSSKFCEAYIQNPSVLAGKTLILNMSYDPAQDDSLICTVDPAGAQLPSGGYIYNYFPTNG